MRLWSIHPKYLDAQGISGQWREALLAQKVLQGRTKGWRNHPQLIRFKEHRNYMDAIGYYLLKIYEESVNRNYIFNKNKIIKTNVNPAKIQITSNQIEYEYKLLMERLKKRSPIKYNENLGKDVIIFSHPLFVIVEGDIELWETGYWKKRLSAEVTEMLNL